MKFLFVLLLATTVSMCFAVPCTSTPQPRQKREATKQVSTGAPTTTTDDGPLPSKAGDIADVNTYKNKREANPDEHKHGHDHKCSKTSTVPTTTA